MGFKVFDFWIWHYFLKLTVFLNFYMTFTYKETRGEGENRWPTVKKYRPLNESGAREVILLRVPTKSCIINPIFPCYFLCPKIGSRSYSCFPPEFPGFDDQWRMINCPAFDVQQYWSVFSLFFCTSFKFRLLLRP